MSRYSNIDIENSDAQAILGEALKKDERWGLVIVRCSYESQDKWETFLSVTRERVLHQIKTREPRLRDVEGPDLYDSLDMTVVEDRISLEGANINTTTIKFVEWLKSTGLDELRQGGETLDVNINNLGGEELFMKLHDIPRYSYFIHVSKEMIETFSTDLESLGLVERDHPQFSEWAEGKNFLHIVNPRSILADVEGKKWELEHGTQGDEDAEEEESDDEEGNLSKKVRGETLLKVYVQLLLRRFDLFYKFDDVGFWTIS